MPPAVTVHGLRDLQRALASADRDVRLGVRAELRHVAEPVRFDAEVLARGRIRNIGPSWPTMRTRITRSLVYVAPRERGTRNRRQARPNLGNLLMAKAMEPALHRHEPQLVQRMDVMLDRTADRFNRG